MVLCTRWKADEKPFLNTFRLFNHTHLRVILLGIYQRRIILILQKKKKKIIIFFKFQIFVEMTFIINNKKIIFRNFLNLEAWISVPKNMY